MRYLVLIGDIVASRNSVRRHDLQEQVKAVFAELNQNNAGLISPYTLTLGDEFQVVFNQADRVFTDIFAILATLPVKVRFSLGLGAITTDLNPAQALGMDGPAFYNARDGINKLKKQGDLYNLEGLADDLQALANASLRLFSHTSKKWRANRYVIIKHLLRGWSVDAIVKDLAISEQAVYKNINSGGIEVTIELVSALTDAINTSLQRK